MTDDQHQPAAVAPRLSEDEIGTYREMIVRCCGDHVGHQHCRAFGCGDVEILVDALDATRADLARTRAEADALTRERDDAVTALNDQLAALQAAIDRAKDFPCPACGHHLTVASTCETPQPAAPVAPQVRFITDQPEDDLRDPCWCGLPRATCNAPFPNLPHSAADNDLYEHPRHAERTGACTSSEHAAPVAPSAEASDPSWIRRGFSAMVHGRSWPYVTCMDCGWLTYTDSPTVVHHTADCPRATTPSDHQAGDES